MTHYATLLAQNGGIANVGEHLAVFVAPAKHATDCPAGWTFVALETATPEIVQDAIDSASQGRKNWPQED